MPRRRVRQSDEFIHQAERLFPRAGSAAGRPTFETFARGPLRGAEIAFSLDFEAQRQHIEGVGSIRFVMIPPTAFFGPLVISACLLSDAVIELVSVIEDEGYWDAVLGDPSD